MKIGPRARAFGAAALVLSYSLIVAGDGATIRAAMAEPGAADARSPIISIHYSRAVSATGTLAAEIVSSGDSTASLDACDEHGPAEIGLYRAPLGQARFAELRKALEAAKLETIVRPGMLQPGMRTTSVGLRRAGDKLPTMHTFVETPAALAPALRAIDAAVAELRKHPLRTLRGQATWQSSEAVRGGSASLAITLGNSGRQPLRWSNPLARGGEWSGLRLVFDKKGDDDIQRDLTGVELQADPTPSGPSLVIGPGQNVVLHARPKVDLPSGTYRVRLEVHELGIEPNAADRLGGVLTIDGGKLTVKRDGWWRVWR